MRRVLVKSFIESQFAYSPLVWMWCDKIKLEKNNSVTIHLRNLRILATEMYKTNENLAALIIHEIFEQRNIQYNLHTQTDFQLG